MAPVQVLIRKTPPFNRKRIGLRDPRLQEGRAGRRKAGAVVVDKLIEWNGLQCDDGTVFAHCVRLVRDLDAQITRLQPTLPHFCGGSPTGAGRPRSSPDPS